MKLEQSLSLCRDVLADLREIYSKPHRDVSEDLLERITAAIVAVDLAIEGAKK